MTETFHLSHLRELESEAIYVLRETAAQFENPGLLFSGGKDSIVMAHLAAKAFHPARLPFPLVHIDTGHNFAETIEFRDNFVRDYGARLIIGSVQDSIDKGTAIEETGPTASRNAIQTVTLLETIEKYEFDALLGGGRRDEEKARAKERFFSHRDAFGQWQPKNQRPELWNIFNGRKNFGENFRVFPLSNWTEMDVWQYIHEENIPVVDLYFAKERPMYLRGDALLPTEQEFVRRPGEQPTMVKSRLRSLGCSPCTGAIRSDADTIPKIIEEILGFRSSERANRAIDHDQEGSMEIKKREGYF